MTAPEAPRSRLDDDAVSVFQFYCDITGVTYSSFIDEALDQFSECEAEEFAVLVRCAQCAYNAK